MELFDKELITSTFNTIASDIVLNPDSDEQYNIKGFITNGKFGKDASYYLHSTDQFKCGDYFNYDGDFYLITSDVVKRGFKYKGQAELCNITFPIVELVMEIIDYDEFGRPIYDYVERIVGYNYGVIKQYSVGLQESVFLIATSDLILTLKDTEMNRNLYTVNYEIEFEGNNYKIIERDFTKKGIINCRLTKVT